MFIYSPTLEIMVSTMADTGMSRAPACWHLAWLTRLGLVPTSELFVFYWSLAIITFITFITHSMSILGLLLSIVKVTLDFADLNVGESRTIINNMVQ